MTSLFRRSSSNGSSQSSSAQELNNSRPTRQVRRLEFNQAMEDFKTMFPNMDYDIIECVLRANNGAVDATIDQLLQMNLDGSGYDDSSDSDDSIPPEILERTLEPDSSDEEPPPVYSPPSYDMHVFDRQYPQAPPTPPPRIDVQNSSGPQAQRRYRNWNPPLLGNLPDDFLRILPQQMDRVQVGDRLKYESKKSKMSGVTHSNDVSFSSVISDDVAQSLTSVASGAVSEDALFRDKLKHMGKSTRKKLFELARAFSEKTKMRKSKRKQLLKHQVESAGWGQRPRQPIFLMTLKDIHVMKISRQGDVSYVWKRKHQKKDSNLRT
ncbi:hypothetical protein lerEdw1_001818 [Lerista edwardsae]|nr:hypothetical protein lerEdw1_001818 [Lerista edwardsae]